MREVIILENNYCKNCIHFRQHYALDRRKIYRVHCGHCMLRNSRKKQPDAAACDSFALALPDSDAFATKEYLSKELLQYLLHLELLPSIEDETKQV